MIISEEQEKFLRKHIDSFDAFLKEDDVDGLLDAISDYQLEVGFEKDGEPNKFGLEIERISDEVLSQNDD